MPFDLNLPQDTDAIAEGPGVIRENNRALKADRIVDAGKLKGFEPGHAKGNIPISDDTLNVGLNADKLDGLDSAAFAPAAHVHPVATKTSNGFMANTDKLKLDGIAASAEVNQNAYSKVSAGGTVLTAGAKQDTLTIKGDGAVSVTGDASSNVVTLGVALGQLLTSSVSVDDWDKATELGARYFLAGKLPHGPTPGETRKDAFHVFAMRISPSNITQVAIPYNNADRPYVRSQYFDGIWSVWRGLSWTYDKAPSASAADTATKADLADQAVALLATRSNEVSIGPNSKTGTLYINYRGATTAINTYLFSVGDTSGKLANVKAKTLLVTLQMRRMRLGWPPRGKSRSSVPASSELQCSTGAEMSSLISAVLGALARVQAIAQGNVLVVPGARLTTKEGRLRCLL